MSDIKDDTTSQTEKYILEYELYWWKVPHLLKLNLLLFIPITGGTLVGFDAYLINSLQMMDLWVRDMAYTSQAALGALTAGPSFGFIITILPARYASDKYGRKRTMIVGATILTIGIIIQICSNNYASFIVSRIICGCGLSFELISAPAWIAELSFPQHRTTLVTCFNTTNFVGAFIASWVAYGSFHLYQSSWQWRLPCLSQLIITIPQLMFIWFLPESPRFLVFQNKVDEAREVLMRVHGGNNEEKAGKYIDQELKEIIETLEQEKKIHEEITISTLSKFLVFFKSKANLHIFAICSFIGFMQYNLGIYSISFYLDPVLEVTGITSDASKMLISAFMSLFNCICSILTVFIVGKIGRRIIFLSCAGSLLGVYIIFVVLSAINAINGSDSTSLAKGILAMIFFCCFFYDVGFLGTLFLYVTEILPYTLRSSGLLLFTLTSQVWSIINAFVTPVGMNSIGWKFYIIYACSILFCFTFMYFMFPETKGLNLEESSKVLGYSEEMPKSNNEKSDLP